MSTADTGPSGTKLSTSFSLVNSRPSPFAAQAEISPIQGKSLWTAWLPRWPSFPICSGPL